MGLATFKGGIHPYEGKELSENYSNLKTIELNCCKNENKCVIMFIQ